MFPQYYAQYLLSANGLLMNCKTLKRRRWKSNGYSVSINGQSVTIPIDLVRFITRRRIAMFVNDVDPYSFQLKIDHLQYCTREMPMAPNCEMFVPCGNVYPDMLILQNKAFGIQGTRLYQAKKKIYIRPEDSGTFKVHPVEAAALDEFFSASNIWFHHKALYENVRITPSGRVLYPRIVVVHNRKNYHLDPGGWLLLDDQDYPAGMLLEEMTPMGPRVAFHDYTTPDKELLFDKDIYRNEICIAKEGRIMVPSSEFTI